MVFLDPHFAQLFPNKELRHDDVLTVRMGANVGDTATVPPEYVGCHTFTTLITSPSEDMLTSRYLVNYVASEFGIYELNRLLVGGGKENLNVGEFVKLRISLPPVQEQVWCIESLAAVDSKINSEKLLMQKYQLKKTGLMQDLLTGKVRVQVDKEVADV